MELHDIERERTDMRPDDADDSDVMNALSAKLGELAEFELTDGAEYGEQADTARAVAWADLVIGCVDYAMHHDIDMDDALQNLMAYMQAMYEQQQAIEDAVEDGDAKALADALDTAQNEVPTGIFDDEDADTRGFY